MSYVDFDKQLVNSLGSIKINFPKPNLIMKNIEDYKKLEIVTPGELLDKSELCELYNVGGHILKVLIKSVTGRYVTPVSTFTGFINEEYDMSLFRYRFLGTSIFVIFMGGEFITFDMCIEDNFMLKESEWYKVFLNENLVNNISIF